MELKELSNLRLKQVAVTNGLVVTTLIIFFMMISVFNITFAHFFLVLGVVVLFQMVFGFIKRDSTKSIIPIIEKVAIYEKQKMGSEWYKQRKVSHIWNLLLSCILFLQSYLYWGNTDNVFQIDIMFMIIITFLFLVMFNFTLFMHIRKVDRATSELDMKGYTWKSNLIAIAVGIVTAFFMIFIIITYVLSGI